MDNVVNNMTDPNIAIFEEYKRVYPNLATVEYKNGSLVFPNGGKISVFNLRMLPTTIFEMEPNNIYIYLSNNFHRHNEDEYNKEINQMFNYFTQLIITEDEEIVLKRFAYDFWLRLQLYANEKSLSKDEEYMKELMARRKVITESYRSASVAANIITETYNQNLVQTQSNSSQSTNNGTKSNEQSLALARTKSGVPKTISDDAANNLSIAGFASVIIIVCTALTVGAYLALALLK